MTYAIQSVISHDSYYSRYLTGAIPLSIFLRVMKNSQKKLFYSQDSSNKKIALFGVSIRQVES